MKKLLTNHRGNEEIIDLRVVVSSATRQIVIVCKASNLRYYSRGDELRNTAGSGSSFGKKIGCLLGYLKKKKIILAPCANFKGFKGITFSAYLCLSCSNGFGGLKTFAFRLQAGG